MFKLKEADLHRTGWEDGRRGGGGGETEGWRGKVFRMLSCPAVPAPDCLCGYPGSSSTCGSPAGGVWRWGCPEPASWGSGTEWASWSPASARSSGRSFALGSRCTRCAPTPSSPGHRGKRQLLMDWDRSDMSSPVAVRGGPNRGQCPRNSESGPPCGPPERRVCINNTMTAFLQWFCTEGKGGTKVSQQFTTQLKMFLHLSFFPGLYASL